MSSTRPRAKNNRTIVLDDARKEVLARELAPAPRVALSPEDAAGRVFHGDCVKIMERLPDGFAAMAVLDPPYNLTKTYNKSVFRSRSEDAYRDYLASWMPLVKRLVRPGGAVYLCCDWKCTAACFEILRRHFIVRNRITWQREKGRAAGTNWKNACEDIWYAVVPPEDAAVFHADAVRMKRKVIAPYREGGRPKDWTEEDGGKFRLTGASNFWDDISVPFWSMPENTDHPAQKPEKLIAKLILASTDPGDLVFDPFSGSGTTAVTAKKLGRTFTAIEQDFDYCCLALERLHRADADRTIQGYEDGVFWERNTLRAGDKCLH